MKLLTTSALALCLAVMIGCAEGNAPSPDALATFENANNTVEANVTGMDCTGCSGSIESALTSIKGVEAAMADVASGDVKVALADDVDAEAVKAEIEQAIAGLSDGKFKVQTIAVSTAGDDHGHDHADEEEEGGNEENAGDEQASAEDTALEFTSYKVSGMDCSGCSTEVAFAVEDIEGISKAKADHKTGTVIVAFDEGVSSDDKREQIKTVIAGLSDGKYTFNN
ncbi:MAG: cation transporter [Phycisphaeraceae bacterium]|nr:cation transporter [Phycisphaeraceae bacterium]